MRLDYRSSITSTMSIWQSREQLRFWGWNHRQLGWFWSDTEKMVLFSRGRLRDMKGLAKEEVHSSKARKNWNVKSTIWLFKHLKNIRTLLFLLLLCHSVVGHHKMCSCDCFYFLSFFHKLVWNKEQYFVKNALKIPLQQSLKLSIMFQFPTVWSNIIVSILKNAFIWFILLKIRFCQK